MFLTKALKVVLVLYNLAVTGALMYQGGISARGPEDFALFLFLIPVAIYLVSSLLPTRPSPIRLLALILGLVTSTVLFIANFLGAASSTEYVMAGLILPLPAFFWAAAAGRIVKAVQGKPAERPKAQPRPSVAWEDLPKETLSTSPESVQSAGVVTAAPAVAPAIVPEPEIQTNREITEPSRRDFLKKAGGVGLGLIAWSILNPKRVGAAFFGSVPGPGTVAIKDTTDTKIDPAIKGYQSRTTSYGITEIDDGDPAYYGFINKDGSWYILKEDETTGDFAYRYASPINNPALPDFLDAWNVHDTTLDYVYFDDAFTS